MSRRWKFIKVHSVRWALVPALDELLYQHLELTQTASQQEVVAAFRRDTQPSEDPDVEARPLAAPAFTGGTLLGARAVGWTILSHPLLRILYHLAGYPLVHLVHAWLQNPRRDLHRLRLMALAGAIVAYERHGNARAIRHYWRLLPGMSGDMPARYAALLQGALYVLPRGTGLCGMFFENLSALQTEGSDLDRAVLRFLLEEGRGVDLAIVPITLGNESASSASSPSAFVIGLHLPEDLTRAGSLAVSHWTLLEDATTTPLNRGTSQQEARAERPVLWMPPGTSFGNAVATQISGLTVQVQPLELCLDFEPALRPTGKFLGSEEPWGQPPVGAWVCMWWTEKGLEPVSADFVPALLPRPVPCPDENVSREWARMRQEAAARKSAALPASLWDYRRAQALTLCRKYETMEENRRRERPSAAVPVARAPTPLLVPLPRPRVTETSEYTRRIEAMLGVSTPAGGPPGLSGSVVSTPTSRCQQWVATTQAAAFSPAPSGVVVTGTASAAAQSHPLDTPLSGSGSLYPIPASNVLGVWPSDQENFPSLGRGRGLGLASFAAGRGAVPKQPVPGTPTSLGPPLREAAQVSARPSTREESQKRKAGAKVGSGRSKSPASSAKSRACSSQGQAAEPRPGRRTTQPSAAQSAPPRRVAPPRWSSHFPPDALAGFPDLTPEIPPANPQAFRAWGSVMLSLVPPGPARIPTTKSPGRAGRLVPFPWFAERLAWAGLHTGFSGARRGLLSMPSRFLANMQGFFTQCAVLASKTWDSECVWYNLLHWLPASLYVPQDPRPWKTRERIHRALRSLRSGWPTMFDRFPALAEYYEALSELLTGFALSRDFPVGGLTTPGATSAAWLRTQQRRERRKRRRQLMQGAEGEGTSSVTRTLPSDTESSASSSIPGQQEPEGMEGVEVSTPVQAPGEAEPEAGLRELASADTPPDLPPATPADEPRESGETDTPPQLSIAMDTDLGAEEPSRSEEPEPDQGDDNLLSVEAEAAVPAAPVLSVLEPLEGGQLELTWDLVPTLAQAGLPDDLLPAMSNVDLVDVYCRLPRRPTPTEDEDDWLATLDRQIRTELELDLVGLTPSAALDTEWLWQHANSWTGRRYLTLPCREALGKELEALGDLTPLDSFKVDAVGPIYYSRELFGPASAPMVALCRAAKALKVPSVWVISVNPNSRKLLEPWQGFVDVYCGSDWRVCLLDPIAHPVSLRRFCDENAGRVAVSYSFEGLKNPAVVRALVAQTRPLLQVHSADAHTAITDRPPSHVGYEVAKAIIALAHHLQMPLSEMVEMVSQGTRAFWGETPADAPLADQRELVQRALTSRLP